MTTTIIFNIFGLKISIKVGSSIHSFYRYLGYYDAYTIDDTQYKGKVSPAEVSVGINLKE